MNYAIIKRDEIAILSQNRCSGAVWAVYSILSSHCFKSNSCFPAIKTILELLHHSISERSVYAALQKLERIGLIKRAARTNRERFTLVMRKIANKVKESFKPKRRNMQNPAPHCRTSQHKIRRPLRGKKKSLLHKDEKHKIINKEQLKHDLEVKLLRKDSRNHFKSTEPGLGMNPGELWVNKCSLNLVMEANGTPDMFPVSKPPCNEAAVKALFSDFYPAMKHRDTIIKKFGKWLDFKGYEWLLNG